MCDYCGDKRAHHGLDGVTSYGEGKALGHRHPPDDGILKLNGCAMHGRKNSGLKTAHHSRFEGKT